MYLTDMRLNPSLLVRFAHDQGHNRGSDEDLGYAVHAWLKASLGEHSPRTHQLSDLGARGLRLLCYTDQPADVLLGHAREFSEPLAFSACQWDVVASKKMPLSWPSGRRLGFEVRVCPVSRGERGERDVYLARVADKESSQQPMSREEVYGQWLRDQFATAAVVESVLLTGFRLTSTYRRRHQSGGQARSGRRVIRPDVRMQGVLTIADGPSFSRLLARGIGRHRAFGFGMVLLRPAG